MVIPQDSWERLWTVRENCCRMGFRLLPFGWVVTFSIINKPQYPLKILSVVISYKRLNFNCTNKGLFCLVLPDLNRGGYFVDFYTCIIYFDTKGL